LIFFDFFSAKKIIFFPFFQKNPTLWNDMTKKKTQNQQTNKKKIGDYLDFNFCFQSKSEASQTVEVFLTCLDSF
jgi:hypothetical protein